jgi:DNA-binding LacI/PurR family transcriptional regulator/signal transduction histidine kinase
MPEVERTQRRPVIGFLVDSLFEGYQEGIWRGVLAAAESFDANLLCFVTPFVGRGRAGRTLCDLIDRRNIDGLISLSGVLLRGATDQELAAYYRRLSPLPVVPIGLPHCGLPSVQIDNGAGMAELISHLIEIHGRRRIAFIRGPATNLEAGERFAVYRATLKRHGIPLDPALTFQGDFTRHAGVRAIQAFLDERKVAIDAVVAANDYMAMFAMRELQRRGISVPHDVSVAGFDDIDDATSLLPPLTTAGQPLIEIGKEAVKKLLALIRGEAVAHTTVLPTSMVIRRSCGCRCDRRSDAIPEGWRSRAGSVTAVPSAEELATLLERLVPDAGSRLRQPAWARDLATAFLEHLDAPASCRFLDSLEATLTRGASSGFPPSTWYSVLTRFFEAVRPQLAGELAPRLHRIEVDAVMLVGQVAEQVQAMHRVEYKEGIRVLPNTIEITQPEEEDVRQGILCDLPSLGIQSFYLSRYVDESQLYASPFVHYAQSENVQLDPALELFESTRLIPGRFSTERRWAYVVLPLHARGEQMGFALCEAGPLIGAAYDFIMSQIGTALKVVSLMSEIRRHASALETKVQERTNQLGEVKKQLIEAARHAGMAEIAVGVMHNIGNLLNSVSVSGERISDFTQDGKVAALLKASALFRSQQRELAPLLEKAPKLELLFEYYARLAEGIDQNRQGLEREAAELLSKINLIGQSIRMLQDYAKGGSDMVLLEEVDLPAAIDSALALQELLVGRHGISVQKDLEPVLPIVTQRATVVHVLVNVIKNAIESMREMPSDRRVLTIQVRGAPGDGVTVRCSDTGQGIPPERLERMFTYGFTTKSDGNGFGLHACATHMREMGGSISVESGGQGQGATFTLLFAPRS